MNALGRTWGMWIVRGIASLLFGAALILRPGASILAMVLVYSAFALADGALLLGFGARYEGKKAPFIVRGLISVAAGIVALVYPGPTALALYVLIGAWALVAGAAELGIAFAARREGLQVGTLVAAGLLSMAWGVALLALPAAGIVALIGLIAAFAMFNGIVLIAVGVGIHSLTRPRHAT
jgi:uncharacterized membrane protein HdeD (DUF308 family)